MQFTTYLASEYAKLDSNVYTGGGTDDTAALQALLDRAGENAGVRLILDGAALVSSLRLSSNTVIECRNRDCGFFQLPDTNRAILTNRCWNDYTPATRNITLLGGTYNQDCLHQKHDIPTEDSLSEGDAWVRYSHHATFGLEFYGVENLLLRDLRIRNFRTYALAVGCFRNVTIEDTWLELPDHMNGQNQDGFHFWGPGQFLTVRNVGGRVGDDFMNIGPDEKDKISSITDVLVDGVFLEEADQAIRLLTRDKGRLDRVTLRNISGIYKSYGFYINPWFNEPTMGNFGNIFIENVDLQAQAPNYDYRAPMLFGVGGNIETLVLKNIRSHQSYDNRELLELGYPFAHPCDTEYLDAYAIHQKLGTVILDDLLVTEEEGDPKDTCYVGVHGPVQRLIIRNPVILKPSPDNSALVAVDERGSVEFMAVQNPVFENLPHPYRGREKIRRLEGAEYSR